MSKIFSKKFFVGNRQRLRELVQADYPIVVTANGLLQRTGDNPFPFAQDSNFWYLTGIDEPDIILVIEVDAEYLIVPGRSASREAFDGAVDHGGLMETSGITTVLDETDGWERLEAWLRRSKKIAIAEPAPNYIEQHGLYTNPARARLKQRLLKIKPELETIDIRSQLAGLRVVKQQAELAALRQAIDITIDSLQVLTKPERFAGYKNEFEIEADLGREFRYRGAAGHAFAPIIAGGKRACTLHNVDNTAKLQMNSLIVIDVGAEVRHYAADITRVRVYGQPTERQQAVFAAVLDAQAFALDLLRPGVVLKEYEQQVEKYIGKALYGLGLLKTSQTGDRASIRKYYPHATSHFLGLDVHDVGDMTRPLEPDMVLTCEPGIYIPEEGIGVRIEDDILITEEGNEVLSARLPKTLM